MSEASVNYDKQFDNVIVNMETLKDILETHSKKQQSDNMKADWGMSGDLAHVNEILEGLISYLK